MWVVVVLFVLFCHHFIDFFLAVTVDLSPMFFPMCQLTCATPFLVESCQCAYYGRGVRTRLPDQYESKHCSRLNL
ncbi:hypothetical protein V8E55_001409, partial [Tylopilus felleus]